MAKRWKIAGINFDHFHMGDLLLMVQEHPEAEIIGIADEKPSHMEEARKNLSLDSSCVFTDYRQLLEKSEPDLVILCPASAEHGLWTERVAPFGVPILVEKPFAATLEEADRMIAAMEKSKQALAINWPLRWYPSHVTAKRLIDEGRIGEVIEVHYYDGNRGPLYHGADKIEKEPSAEEKTASWFYDKDKGGGSMLDYLGYGSTLATWYHNGKAPLEVTAAWHGADGLKVDEHSICIARYDVGLSKFETRWGTFTDPWTQQPQPKCGFVIKGSEGTVSSYDFEPNVFLQTRDNPQGKAIAVDVLESPFDNPINYVIHCLDTESAIEGPLSPAIARIGQQIVDTAYASAEEKRTLPLKR